MKQPLAIALLVILLLTSAVAAILPARGVDADFLDLTGIECAPAVQLCKTLEICDDRNGHVIMTHDYADGCLPVIEIWDGWAQIYIADENETGWVRSEFLLMDPAWYVCEASTEVYADDDPLAPRVALLNAGSSLAIIREDAEWVLVSMEGGAGWIRKTPADTVSETWFRPDDLMDMTAAQLVVGERTMELPPEHLDTLRTLLTNVEDTGGLMAGCPFTATLRVTLTDGRVIDLALATDSCCAYRVDERDYLYARNLCTEDSGVSNAALFSLFEEKDE